MFSVALLNALRSADGNVVFDEVVHGFTDQLDSPYKLLFQFPFVLATIQGAIAVVLLLWATLRRFGAPVSPPRPLQAGKRSLIETTANLLDIAPHRPIMIQRYVHATVADVARQLHAPAGLSQAALVEWLGRAGRARAVAIDCTDLVRSADELAAGGRAGAAALTTLARNIFRWKLEVLDGGPRDSGSGRSHSPRNRQGDRRSG
jgi:hypothetical protein